MQFCVKFANPFQVDLLHHGSDPSFRGLFAAMPLPRSSAADKAACDKSDECKFRVVVNLGLIQYAMISSIGICHIGMPSLMTAFALAASTSAATIGLASSSLPATSG